MSLKVKIEIKIDSIEARLLLDWLPQLQAQGEDVDSAARCAICSAWELMDKIQKIALKNTREQVKLNVTYAQFYGLKGCFECFDYPDAKALIINRIYGELDRIGVNMEMRTVGSDSQTKLLG